MEALHRVLQKRCAVQDNDKKGEFELSICAVTDQVRAPGGYTRFKEPDIYLCSAGAVPQIYI